MWTDTDGLAVPTTKLTVMSGPEHCGWEDMTFLSLGRTDREATFVREPDSDLSDYFAEPYRAHAQLPDGAVDTGFRHGGDRLWLAPDHSRAYVGAVPDDVEVWPRTVQRLGCA